MAIINGTSGNDRLNGTSSSDSIYGGYGNDTIYGYAGNDYIDGGAGNDSMIGGTGNDIYIVDSYSDTVIENANEGIDEVRAAGITYTLGNNLENLRITGTFGNYGHGNSLDNYITGSAGSNRLYGYAGNDTLDGGGGANDGYDTLYGGIGDDVYFIYNDSNTDTVVENLDEGYDIVKTYKRMTLPTNVERMELLGTTNYGLYGNSSNSYLVGNSGNNDLTDYAGNDTLDGGIGIDTLAGGLDNDTYIVDNVGDVVRENAGEGNDLVYSSVSYTLADNVENLNLTGSSNINATGNAIDNYLTGNSGNNVLTGYAGNDILDGGAGADTMLGGLDNDSYYVDNANDIVTENIGEGNDLVYSSVSYILADNVENLNLTGSSNINATGNAIDNYLTGSSGNNVLTGYAGNDILDGGAGADTMLGGLDNDTYYVDNANDIVTENTGEGNDLVYSSVSYTLADNVESLSFIGNSNITGVGNELDNYIEGNTGNNTLSGSLGNDTINGYYGSNILNGDAGNDVLYMYNSSNLYSGNSTLNGGADNDILYGNNGSHSLIGGTGNDTYYVDDAGDILTENLDEGIDTVYSSISCSLGDNLENLTLEEGSGNINGTGNALDNTLIGNTGANILEGGSGNDTYTFNLGDGLDSIQDTSGISDKVNFSSNISQSNIAFFKDSSNNLIIDYATNTGQDCITVMDQNNNTVEKFELNSGLFLTDYDVNNIVNYIAGFDIDPGMAGLQTAQSINDVKGNSDLMTYISGQWHT